MRPLFRWAGSKRKILPHIKKHFPKSHNRYFEPFCGSACLYFDTRPQIATLSDMNSELIHAYLMVRDSPTQVHEFLSSLTVNPDEYRRIRSLDERNLAPHERAGRFIYLNKLCFNGVYRTNLQGRFNVPMGVKTGSIPTLDELLAYSAALEDVEFSTGDFQAIVDRAIEGDFIYLDPPYSKPESRKRGEYGPNSFDYGDIQRLVDSLKSAEQRGASFILSYCESDSLLESIPSDWVVESLSVRRHVAGFHQHRRVVPELLIYNHRAEAREI